MVPSFMVEPDLSLYGHDKTIENYGVATEWNEIKEEIPCMLALFHQIYISCMFY
jgi:hypothetical protein